MLFTWFLTRVADCICAVYYAITPWRYVDYSICVDFYSITFLNCVDYCIRVFLFHHLFEHVLIIAFVMFFILSLFWTLHFFNTCWLLPLCFVLIPSLFWTVLIIAYMIFYSITSFNPCWLQWVVWKVPTKKQKCNLYVSLYKAFIYLECTPFL